MSRAALKKIPLKPVPRFTGWGPRLHLIFLGLFLVQFVLVWLSLGFGLKFLGTGRWPDGLLLVLATAATLSWVGRQLPGQNVVLASTIIAFIAGLVQSIGAWTGIPFGPYFYTESIGPQIFYPLPWVVPLMWVVIILTSRGVARLVLRPWRKIRVYGFWVIGLTTLLVVLLDFGLEPFATHVRGLWLWAPTKARLDWYNTPWVNFIGWAVTTLLILAFATPALINKRSTRHPPEYQPLVIWLCINFLLATGAAVHRLWPAMIFVIVASLLATVFAIRGAKW